MSDMKCPFCQQAIMCMDAQDADEHSTWYCPRCIAERAWYAFGNETLWQELIRTRKALEIAKDTFNWIDETYQTGQDMEAEIWGKVQLAAQEITALEKSELENLEMLVNNVLK